MEALLDYLVRLHDAHHVQHFSLHTAAIFDLTCALISTVIHRVTSSIRFVSMVFNGICDA